MNEWKETVIGKLPAKWDVELIGNLIEDKGIAVGVMYPGNYCPDGVPLIRVGDVRNNKIDDTDNYKISNEVNTSYKRTILQGGELLVVLVGNPGVAAVVPKDKKGWNVARAIGVLKLKDISTGKYLSYSLRHPEVRHNLLASCNTTVQPTLNLKELKEIAIPWPDHKNREAIAEVLSAFDDKIDLLRRQNKTLEALAETIFRKWLMEDADGTWKTVPLEYVTIRITDGSHHSPRTTAFGLPMASVKDMYDWGVDISSCRKIAEEDYYELVRNDCRPLKDDVVIAKDGSYLKHIFVAPKDLDVVILSSIAILRPNGKYNPLLLATLLKMKSTIENLKNIVTGGVIPRIVLKDFRKFPIKLPPTEIQNKALQHIEPIYQKCWHNDAQIKTLTQLRDTLLPKLMSGEVSLNNCI